MRLDAAIQKRDLARHKIKLKIGEKKMKKYRLFISSKKDLKELNKKIAIDSLFSVGETITNSPLVIGENVISDKRILDSFNEFMNYGKVSGVLIIEEI